MKYSKTIQLIFTSILAIFSSNLLAQYNYYPEYSIPITHQGNLLENPFQGGFNAPQFNQIDLNQDGKLDLIIFDRAGNRITPMINNGNTNQIDYEYAPQYISAFPFIEEQLYTRDYDCDGDLDLFIVGSNSSISVFENQSSSGGGLNFSLVTKIQTNYRPLVVNLRPSKPDIIGVGDVDQDGDIDIVLEYSSGSQLSYHKNLSMENNSICGLDFEIRSKCWGDFIESGISSTIYLDSCRFTDFSNPELNGNSKTREAANEKGNKHGSSAISIFDLDENGSMDVVLGDDGSKSLIALFNADSTSPYTNSHMFRVDTTFPSYSQPANFNVFPAAYFLDIDNDNREDMIIATNSDDPLTKTYNKNQIQFYKRNLSDSKFTLTNDKLFSDDILDFGLGCHPAFFDYNKDGLQDLMIGNFGYFNDSLNDYQGQLALLVNTGTTNSPSYSLVDTNFLDIPSLFTNNQGGPLQNLSPAFADLDGDGDQDFLLGNANGSIHYFKDTSITGNAAFKLVQKNFQKLSVFESSAPALADINGDNLPDLIIGNNIGRLDYHQNYGTPQNPIFNLEIQSIIWQYDTIIRYQLKGNPNLNNLSVGDQIDVNNEQYPNNGVFQTISAINNQQKYIDCINPYRRNSLDDEPNSNAVIDYSIKNWGNLNLSNINFSRNAVPFVYSESSKTHLIVGSSNGSIFLIDSLSNIQNDTFRIIDSSYVSNYLGGNVTVGGTDFNNDGYIDLAIGNKAGGIRFFIGLNNVGLEDKSDKNEAKSFNFSISPNPTQNRVTLNIEKSYVAKNNSLKLYDLNGRLIEELNPYAKTIDLSNFSSGLYFISYQDEHNQETQKLIIQK